MDTKIYKNQNEILCTTICRKPNVRCNFLQHDSAHPKFLKNSITFSQALRIKRIYTEASEIVRYFKDLKDAFIKRDYKPQFVDYPFETAMRVH